MLFIVTVPNALINGKKLCIFKCYQKSFFKINMKLKLR